jgi:hypothetical protein
MEYTILIALIIILLLYISFFSGKESFENSTVKPRKECSDVALSKGIFDYQLSPLNQLKTPK